MPSLQLEFNRQALGDLALRGNGIRSVVADVGAAIHSDAASDIEDEVTMAVGGKGRARAYVRRTGSKALANEGRDGALARALRNARFG